jgi:hypothetical protein
VDSLIHLCERSNHHDCIDDDVLAAGATDVDEHPMTLYLGYDCGFEYMYISIIKLSLAIV